MVLEPPETAIAVASIVAHELTVVFACKLAKVRPVAVGTPRVFCPSAAPITTIRSPAFQETVPLTRGEPATFQASSVYETNVGAIVRATRRPFGRL